MIYTPRYIIYNAVCHYLDKETKEKLDRSPGKSEKITDASFIKIIGQHFDFMRMRDSPRIKEDLWLFNYLMYENTKKDNFPMTDIGNRIAFKGRLVKKGLILQYEKKIFPGT